MGMLKSRADELGRRLNQTKDTAKESIDRLGHFVEDIKVLAGEAEKIEAENIQLKKEIQEQDKKHAEEMEKSSEVALAHCEIIS